jgi:signal transduction histidine kinase
LERAAEQSAHALGRAIAGHLNEARRARGGADLDLVLETQLGDSVVGVALYDVDGRLERRVGERSAALPEHVRPDLEEVVAHSLAEDRALLVTIPGSDGPVAVLLAADAATARAGPLARLVALYTALLGVALLLLCYVAMTRMVVTPIEQLSRAAQRVAEGARGLTAPRSGGPELARLGRSLEEMTERLRAEEAALRDKVTELEAKTEELRQAQQVLIRSERLASVGRLAAGLAHEIGNPLTAVLGLLELLREGGLSPEEQRDFFDRITRETERINRVLRDLLDFARPAVRETQAASNEPSDGARAEATGSVELAVTHVLALVRPQKALANVTLEERLSPGLPAVAMHQSRIEQVLLNLVLNAADQLAPNGGTVLLEAQATDQAVSVAVEDDGGGIDPAVRDRLFEPFVSTKEVGKGTGLGLAVCRGLVEAAGGHIEVVDGRKGARFVLELPRSA